MPWRRPKSEVPEPQCVDLGSQVHRRDILFSPFFFFSRRYIVETTFLPPPQPNGTQCVVAGEPMPFEVTAQYYSGGDLPDFSAEWSAKWRATSFTPPLMGRDGMGFWFGHPPSGKSRSEDVSFKPHGVDGKARLNLAMARTGAWGCCGREGGVSG